LVSSVDIGEKGAVKVWCVCGKGVGEGASIDREKEGGKMCSTGYGVENRRWKDQKKSKKPLSSGCARDRPKRGVGFKGRKKTKSSDYQYSIAKSVGRVDHAKGAAMKR